MAAGDRPLQGARVVSVAINIPADVAAARLAAFGAAVVKVEPPGGDPLERESPAWYEELTRGQSIERLELKRTEDRARLDLLLADADVLITSMRRSALARLGLGREALEDRFPRLVHVAIVGHSAGIDDLPGHDLTYAARVGLIAPPQLPLTLVADLGGAERTVSVTLALLLARERGGPRCAELALEDCARFFAAPLRHGITGPGRILGGAQPFYGLYRSRDGWLALAALEPHFERRVREQLELAPDAGAAALSAAFATRTSAEWDAFAQEHDLPLVAVMLTA